VQVVAGVDCHQDTHSIVFLNFAGQLQKQLLIETTAEGYRQAVEAAAEFQEVQWGLESTGCYGSAFAKHLVEAGAIVFEVPGAFTKRHRKRASQSGKSDPLDAKAIAEAVLRESDRLPRFEWSVEREAIRLRYDQRDRLVRERTKHINRLRNAALRLDLRSLPADLSCVGALEQVRIAAQALQGKDAAVDALVDEILFTVEDIMLTIQRVKNIEVLLRPLLRRVAPELLAMHGVSTVIAAGLIGHAGNLRNIRDAGAFAMRCGVAPISWSSGRSSAVRINTGGNRQLNRLLHLAALSQIRSKTHSGRVYYDRKRAEGKTHRGAMRALKRQLCTVVYYRLRSCAAALRPDRSEPIAA